MNSPGAETGNEKVDFSDNFNLKSRKRKLEYITDASITSTSVEKKYSCPSAGSEIKRDPSTSHPPAAAAKILPKNCDFNSDSTNLNSNIKQLSLDLRKEQERLRKLTMVRMYREKNNLEELGELIDKWRDVCQQSLQDLQDLLPSPRPSLKELLDHLQIDCDLVHFDPDSESFS